MNLSFPSPDKVGIEGHFQKAESPDRLSSLMPRFYTKEAKLHVSIPTFAGSNLVTHKNIGSGPRDTVYEVSFENRDITENRLAAKKTNKSECDEHNDNLKSRFLNEVAALLILRHNPNILQLMGSFRCWSDSSFYLLTELATCNLAEYQIHMLSEGKIKLTSAQLSFILSEVMNGVAALVDNGIYNWDIKRHNILFYSNSGRLKLCDFSDAVLYEELTLGMIKNLIRMSSFTIAVMSFFQNHNCKAPLETYEKKQLLNCSECSSQRFNEIVKPWLIDFIDEELSKLTMKMNDGSIDLKSSKRILATLGKMPLEWK